MKTLLPLLILLVACSGRDGDHNKKKTEPVVIPPVVVEETVIDQDVRVPITIFADEIHLSDFGFGKELPENCGPTPVSQKIYSYDLNGDYLTLDDKRVQVTYERIRDDGGLVRGLWQMTTSTDPTLKSSTIEILAVTARFISHCELK
jgi:hypothetical protein